MGRNVCHLVPKVTTKEVSDLECKTHSKRVCKPTYREECEDVKETRTVCNDVPEEICDKKPSSVIHYVEDRQCSIVPIGSVWIQLRKIAMTNKLVLIQRKSMLLNARLTTLRSVLNLAMGG